MRQILRKFLPDFLKIKFRFFQYLIKNKGNLDDFRNLYTHKTSYGFNHPEITFYILRKGPNGAGLLSSYLSFLGQLKKINNKYIVPIVDMKSEYYNIIHNSIDEKGKINAWERYFEKVSKYSIDDVKFSKNVIIGGSGITTNMVKFFDGSKVTKKTIIPWIALDNKYFKLKHSLEKTFNKEYIRLLKGKRVLGVMIREEYEGYVKGQYSLIKGHPVQPKLALVIENVQMYLDKWECDYVYLATDSLKTINKFKNIFHEKLIYSPRQRGEMDFTIHEDYIEKFKAYIKGFSVHQRNTEYLKEIYLLSKCTCLIAGKSSGTLVAALWNKNHYEQLMFYNLGVY